MKEMVLILCATVALAAGSDYDYGVYSYNSGGGGEREDDYEYGYAPGDDAGGSVDSGEEYDYDYDGGDIDSGDVGGGDIGDAIGDIDGDIDDNIDYNTDDLLTDDDTDIPSDSENAGGDDVALPDTPEPDKTDALRALYQSGAKHGEDLATAPKAESYEPSADEWATDAPPLPAASATVDTDKSSANKYTSNAPAPTGPGMDYWPPRPQPAVTPVCTGRHERRRCLTGCPRSRREATCSEPAGTTGLMCYRSQYYCECVCGEGYVRLGGSDSACVPLDVCAKLDCSQGFKLVQCGSVGNTLCEQAAIASPLGWRRAENVVRCESAGELAAGVTCGCAPPNRIDTSTGACVQAPLCPVVRPYTPPPPTAYRPHGHLRCANDYIPTQCGPGRCYRVGHCAPWLPDYVAPCARACYAHRVLCACPAPVYKVATGGKCVPASECA